jgi:hypothetical protein
MLKTMKNNEYSQKRLNIHYFFVIIHFRLWRSILVRSAVYQEGAKNPLKGISLKPLVPASYAQFGVGAGGKNGTAILAFSGRPPMAWRT